MYEEPDESGEGNLYVHHSIMLTAFPLCTTWLDCSPGTADGLRGNFAAVGSFEPGIEVCVCVCWGGGGSCLNSNEL